MRGVKRVLAKGHVYYYHRRTMTRLPGAPDSPPFMAALARLESVRPPAAIAKPGTLDALIAAYRASPEFRERATRTKADYQKIFNYLQPIADTPLREIDGALLYVARDEAFAAKKRRFANYLVQLLRSLFNWARRRGIMEGNPALGVEMIKRPRDARIVNRSWKDEELAAVMAAAPAELKVAIALGAYLGLREADMLNVTWRAYDGTAFEIRQRKPGTELWIPVPSELKTILDATPRRSPIIVIGAKGKPFTESGFRSRFFRMIKKLGSEGKIGPGLTFHGLRHTVGKKLAEGGSAAGTIAAILGHATNAMAEHYSRHADRRDLAKVGMASLERPR